MRGCQTPGTGRCITAPGVELATFDARRAAEAAADAERRYDDGGGREARGTGSRYVTLRGGLRRANPYPPRWVRPGIVNCMWDETVLLCIDIPFGPAR
jgi:hypothetical protein